METKETLLKWLHDHYWSQKKAGQIANKGELCKRLGISKSTLYYVMPEYEAGKPKYQGWASNKILTKIQALKDRSEEK